MTTVLIIEDNPDNMLLISDILSLRGCALETAETGLAGLEKARQHPPDFIVLDIQLPDIDGYQVLTALRRCEETKTVPVVAMTSYAMAGDREKLLAAGCDGYVEKPIDPITVVDQIRAVVGNIL